MCCKNFPVVVTAPITDRCSHRNFVGTLGVCPFRAHVLATVVLRLKPLSSRQTSVTPSSTFFADLRALRARPRANRCLVALQGRLAGFLEAEAELDQEFVHVIHVVPHAELLTDDVPYAGAGPLFIVEAVCDGAQVDEFAEALFLVGCEVLGSSSAGSGFEGVFAVGVESLLPAADGAAVHAEVFGYLPGCELALVQQGLRGEAAFFELRTAEVGGSPDARHDPPYVSRV